MHNWTQVQPAPYDGQYAFPSVLAGIRTPQHHRLKLHHLRQNPDTTDAFRFGKEDMLPREVCSGSGFATGF